MNIRESLEIIKFQDGIDQYRKDIKYENKYRYILINVSKDLKYIVIEKTASIDKTYEDFVNDISQRNACFAIYNYEYEYQNGEMRRKIIMVSWVPEDTSVRQKIIFAAVKAKVKSAFEVRDEEFAEKYSDFYYESEKN